MNREEVKREVATIIERAQDNYYMGNAEEWAEEILSFLDDIGYDASHELELQRELDARRRIVW